METINTFRDEYFFLSNFYEAPIVFGGITYNSNEAAFQAQKTFDENERIRISQMSPAMAKKAGRCVKLRSDWEEVKNDFMYAICLAKFAQNPDLMNKLFQTGNKILVEGNTWNDKEWGVCDGEGKNKLGKILMDVRGYLREHEKYYLSTDYEIESTL